MYRTGKRRAFGLSVPYRQWPMTGQKTTGPTFTDTVRKDREL